MRDLVASVIKKDAPAALDVIEGVYRFGQDLNQLYLSLLDQFRNMMVLKAGYAGLTLPEEELSFLQGLVAEVSLEEIHRCLSVLIRSEEDLKYTSMPRITLETILLRIISAPRVVDLQQLIQAISSKGAVLPQTASPQASQVDLYRRPPSTLPVSWEGFLAYLRDHDSPLHAMITSAQVEQAGQDEVRLICPSQFLADQILKALPDIASRASAFLQKDISLKVEVQGNGDGARKAKPSEMRAQAMKTPIVKEIMMEFDGVVRNVKPRE
jgi:DNA polymerase III gamma/tau subunit